MKKLFTRLQKGKRSRSGSPAESFESQESLNLSGKPAQEIYALKFKDLPKLHKAVWKGDIKKVQILVKREPMTGDKENRTPLHLACSKGNYEIAKELLEFNAKVNVTDNNHRTPLMRAIEANSPDCVKLLIDYHADLTFRDRQGDAAIHYAASHSSIEIMTILLESGVSINTHNEYGLTPIHIAVNKQDIEMVTFLLENEAEINCVDHKKRSALMLGCISGNETIVDLLLRAGSNPKLKDCEGFTAAKYAQLYHNSKCADLVTDVLRDGSDRFSTQSTESMEQDSSDRFKGFSASDMIIVDKPPLPPGVTSTATSNNTSNQINNFNINNAIGSPAFDGHQSLPVTSEDEEGEETGEDILDLVSTTDPADQTEDDEPVAGCVFLTETANSECNQHEAIGESMCMSDILQINLIDPEAVQFANSSVGSALDLTRRPLEMDLSRKVHVVESPIKQDRVPSAGSDASLSHSRNKKSNETSQSGTRNPPKIQKASDMDKITIPNLAKEMRADQVEIDVSNRSQRSLTPCSDGILSDAANSLLHGRRPSPDGGTVSTPSPPIPVMSVNSVASTIGHNISLTDYPNNNVQAEKNSDYLNSNLPSPKSMVYNETNLTEKKTDKNSLTLPSLGKQNDKIDVIPEAVDEDSWKSDTDSCEKEELRKVEALIGQKIREHAGLSFLSRSTPKSSTPNATDLVQCRSKSPTNEFAALKNDEESCWDSDVVSDKKMQSDQFDLGHGDGFGEFKLPSDGRIWQYNEFQTMQNAKHGDWSSETPSESVNESCGRQSLSLGFQNFASTVNPIDQRTEKITSNFPLGSLKQAIEWDSSTEETADNTATNSGNDIAVLGAMESEMLQERSKESTPAARNASIHTDNQIAQRPTSEETRCAPENEKEEFCHLSIPKNATPDIRSSSARDQVVVSIQSGGSEDDDSESTNLSPIAEVEEETQNEDEEDEVIDFQSVKFHSPRGSVPDLTTKNNQTENIETEKEAERLTVLMSPSSDFITRNTAENKLAPTGDTNNISFDHQGSADGLERIFIPNERAASNNAHQDQTLQNTINHLPEESELAYQLSSTRNVSTLHGVPSFSELPKVKDTRPRRIPPRVAQRVKYTDKYEQKENEQMSVLQPFRQIRTEGLGNTPQLYTNAKDERIDVNEEVPTEDEMNSLNDFVERETSTDLTKMNRLFNLQKEFTGTNLTEASRLLPNQQCGSKILSPDQDETVPMPRKLRSSRSQTKDVPLDTTIQDTDSVSLTSDTEPIPLLNPAETYLKEKSPNVSSNKANLTMTDSDDRFSRSSILSSLASGPTKQENLTEMKMHFNMVKCEKQMRSTTKLSHENDETAARLLDAKHLTKQMKRSLTQSADEYIGHSTEIRTSVETLREKLIRALQALYREHICHEELESARDAAEARVREMTLQQAAMVAIGTIDETLGEIKNSEEVQQYAELNAKLMEYRFQLLEERDKRKSAEEELEKIKLDIIAKEKQVPLYENKSEILENKTTQTDKENEVKYSEKYQLENILNARAEMFESTHNELERFTELKVDLASLRRKLQSEHNTWNIAFAQLRLQIESCRELFHKRMATSELLNLQSVITRQNRVPIRQESSTQADLTQKEETTHVNIRVLENMLNTSKQESAEQALQIKQLEDSHNKITQILLQVERKIFQLMSTEKCVYKYLEDLMRDPLEDKSMNEDALTDVSRTNRERLCAFLEVLKVSQDELQKCRLVIHQAITTKSPEALHIETELDQSETTKTTLAALEQLAKMGQRLTATENEANALRSTLKRIQLQHDQEQSAMTVKLAQATRKIDLLGEQLDSRKINLNQSPSPDLILLTKCTQTDSNDSITTNRFSEENIMVVRIKEGEIKQGHLSASASSIGSTVKTQERGCSPIEEQNMETSALSQCACHDNKASVMCHRPFCDMYHTKVTQQFTPECDFIIPQKVPQSFCPHWMQPALASEPFNSATNLASMRPMHNLNTEASMAYSENPKLSGSDFELATLRKRVAELESDRDWLAKENSRLVERTDKQTRLTEKLATRLMQPPQANMFPSPMYPTTPCTIPQPLVISTPFLHSNVPCTAQHACHQAIDANATVNEASKNIIRRPSTPDKQGDNQWTSKPTRDLHLTYNPTEYPEADQRAFDQSSWSIDQDLDTGLPDMNYSVNAQLLENRTIAQKRQLNEKIMDDTFHQLKPELDKSISKHLEAADAARLRLNKTVLHSESIENTPVKQPAHKSDSISLILRNAELSLRTLKNQRRFQSKYDFNSPNYLDILKQKYFL